MVEAATAAGLVETLSAPGEFTIFAPTNDAFDALPAGTLDALLADTDGLTAVLLYHAVSGVVLAEDVVALEAATTLNGADITIEVTEEGGVVLNGTVNVTATDILCSNGVIHVIDAVLLPPQPTFCESWTATCGEWMNETSCEDWWAAAFPGNEGDTTGATQACYWYHLGVAEAQETDEDTMMHCMHAAGEAPCVFEEASIYDTAAATGIFNTLLAAVDAAGLDSTLKGELQTADPSGVNPQSCEELVGAEAAALLAEGLECPEGLTYEGCCNEGTPFYCEDGNTFQGTCEGRTLHMGRKCLW